MDIKDVENLAELARIELTEEEKGGILKDMEGILEYVKVIEKVEVGKVSPEYSHRNVWREDEVIPRDFSRDSILEQFPDSQPARPDGRSGGDGIFLKVKKIL